MDEIRVGDRVYWYANPNLFGTIKQIYLDKHPFYVVWDKGTEDRYKGCYLKKVLDEKTISMVPS
jgi:hypothetical protein